MTLARVIVEVAFDVGASTQNYLQLDDTSRGRLDTGVLGPDTVWTDVTPWLLSWSTRRGSSRVDGPVLRYDPGTLSVQLDNADRRFDPTHTTGPYASAGITRVRPRVAVRVMAEWQFIRYPVLRGFVDAWQVAWDPGAGQGSTVTMTATDGTKVLANVNPMALPSPVGAGESSGARVNRILDNAGWPAADRSVEAGDSAVSGTTMSAAAWTDLLLTADTELGDLYVDALGRVVFRNRKNVLTDRRSTTPQTVLGDLVGDTPYENLTIAYDDTQIVNQALIARVGGTQQVVQDLTSQQTYLRRTVNRSDLLHTTDAESADYAAFLVYQGKDPELRFEQIDLHPATFDGLWPDVLGNEIGTRVTITRNPPGGGAPITRDCYIRGIAHQGSADDWRTQWVLQSATRYAFFVMDHPSLGVLNSNALAY